MASTTTPFEIQPLNKLAVYLRKLVRSRLWVRVIVALLIGIGVGFALNPDIGWLEAELSLTIGDWLALPGQLFLRMVQMIMIPLVFTSIISGIVSNHIDQLKQLGSKLLGYFLLTTIFSITVGTILAYIFRPGNYFSSDNNLGTEVNTADVLQEGEETGKSVTESISELIPNNPLESMISGEMLSIVIFTIIIGLAIAKLKPKPMKPITDVFFAIQEICMQVVAWAMKLVPYAVFGLMAQLVSKVGYQGLSGIGMFIIVVLIGLAILILFYIFILLVFVRINPLRFFSAIKDVQLLAFSTASSAAVMPLSMKTADEKLGVDSKISNFVIPVGATINMDGTAVFQCIAALFVAQSYGIEMELASVALLMLTIVAASVGTPAIPGGGVIILASVLQGAGIPTEGLIIIIGIDRILGMFRTAVNVTGDLTACVLFDKIMKKK